MRGHDHPGMAAVLAFLGAFSLNACGTMLRGPDRRVHLEVNPSDAEVSVYRWTGDRLRDPVRSAQEIQLPRPAKREPYLAVVSREGYCPAYVVTMAHEDIGITILDVLVGGILVGPGIDSSTGGCCSIEPNPIRVTLVQEASCGK